MTKGTLIILIQVYMETQQKIKMAFQFSGGGKVNLIMIMRQLTFFEGNQEWYTAVQMKKI